MEAWIDHQAQLRERTRARPESRGNYTFEIGAVLCVALIAATSWAVLAAGWVNGGGGAAVVAVTSVIEAALLAQARAPRVAAAVAAPFLGLAAIVPTTLAAMPPVAGQTAGSIASHYARALFTGLSSTTDWDFTVGLCAILFVCGYWLGWTALREHRGVLAVIPVFSVLATNVINAKDPDPIAFPETIAVVLALGVIAAAYLGALGDRWASAKITPLEGMRVRFGGSVAAVAVALTVLALIVPPLTDTDLSTRLFPHGLGIGSSGKGGGGTAPGGLATIGFNPSVELGGPLVSKPQLVLTYSVNTNAPVYLRVANDTLFVAGSWLPQSGVSASTNNNWNGVQYQGGPLPRDSDPGDGGIGKEEQPVQATITMQRGATGQQSLVPFTGEPDAVNDPGIAYGTVAPQSPNALLSVDQVVLNQDIASGTTVLTTSLISTATAAQLEVAGTDYPAFIKQYAGLQDDLSHGAQTIQRLAEEWTAGQRNPYDQAIAIENHLRNPANYQYTLNPPPVPNASIWPVVYFLTVSHRGYCQYFASAMGSMLRSLGIPTRLVSGYGPGTTRAQSGRSGQREQTVSTSDAHSWVEAYFPGYGWIPFEPTPPSAQGDYQPLPRGAAAASGGTTTPSSNPTPRGGPTPKPGFGNGQDPGVSRTNQAHGGIPTAVIASLGVLGGVAVLVVVALLWLALPRSLKGAWRRVEALGIITGVDRRRAETHRAYAARLARARPRAAPALGELAAVTARAEFSAEGASQQERALALRTWRRALFAASPLPGRSPG
ncbi:MAG: transglutaminase-like domain-containing protein [Candidatus Dormiibacterota bacterium]